MNAAPPKTDTATSPLAFGPWTDQVLRAIVGNLTGARMALESLLRYDPRTRRQRVVEYAREFLKSLELAMANLRSLDRTLLPYFETHGIGNTKLVQELAQVYETVARNIQNMASFPKEYLSGTTAYRQKEISNILRETADLVENFRKRIIVEQLFATAMTDLEKRRRAEVARKAAQPIRR